MGGGKQTMKTKRRRTPPEVIVRDGEPRAVIVDIDEYQEMLERLDDADDLRALEKMRSRPLRFRKLAELLLQSTEKGAMR